MHKNKWCSLGILIKKRLIDIEKSQEWLISELRKETGLYVDSSNLYKIMTGKLQSEKLISGIVKILKLEYVEEKSVI